MTGGRYTQALERYASAASFAGDDLRIYNGLYLTNLKLSRGEPAAVAFGKTVEYSMARNRFAVNFLFKPGSAVFAAEKSTNANYTTWLNEIARHATQSNACLEVVGHTSRSGPEPLNEKLSLQRAEHIRKNLEARAADLAGRIMVQGAGSRENLVGTASDDMSDSVDRRVAFRVVTCLPTDTQTAHR